MLELFRLHRAFELYHQLQYMNCWILLDIASLLVIHKPAEKKHTPSLGVLMHIEGKNL